MKARSVKVYEGCRFDWQAGTWRKHLIDYSLLHDVRRGVPVGQVSVIAFSFYPFQNFEAEAQLLVECKVLELVERPVGGLVHPNELVVKEVTHLGPQLQ